MPAPHCSVFYRLEALPATQPTASKQDVVLKWQQHQPDHIQTIFTLLQTDNDTNFSSLNFQNTEHNVFGNIMAWSHYQWWSLAKNWFGKLIWDCVTKEAEICGPYLTSVGKRTSIHGRELATWQRQTQTRETNEDLADNVQWGPTWYGTYRDGCKEIRRRQTEMEKARSPMFQQELEELRSK